MHQQRITFEIDHQSHSERSVLALLDGEPAYRMTRAQLGELSRATWNAIRALDWIHATYLEASDFTTSRTHLLPRNGRPSDDLRHLPALCGRKPYLPERPTRTDGWTFQPVVIAPATNTTCKTCRAIFEKRMRNERTQREANA